MRCSRWLSEAGLAVGLAVAVGGCSGGVTPATAPTVTAAHGGALTPLSGGAGYVEIVTEAESKVTKAARGRIIVYFVNADGSAPPSPAPTDVTYTDESRKPYKLEPKTDAAFKGAKFESEPGPFNPGKGLSGELSASMGGSPVKLSLSTR